MDLVLNGCWLQHLCGYQYLEELLGLNTSVDDQVYLCVGVHERVMYEIQCSTTSTQYVWERYRRVTVTYSYLHVNHNHNCGDGSRAYKRKETL